MAKLVITTSRNPSSKLNQFSKSLTNVFPNCFLLNRGTKFFNSLLSFCLINKTTDFIIIYENRGSPLTLVISHLPSGPSIFFGLSNVVNRSKLGKLTKTMVCPHVIMTNMNSPIGIRISNIFELLFSKPKPNSQRIVSFTGEKNGIIFGHYWFHKKGSRKKDIFLQKIDPGFTMKPYKIILNSIFKKSSQIEWVITPFIKNVKKKSFLY